MTVLTMSAAEITRFDTLMRLDRGEIRIADAMELLGLQRRQIYRLLDRLRQEGAAGLVSRKRGRPSNRRYSDVFRAEVVALVRENYADFGPTLAREYLAERHGLGLSCETLRQIMMEAGLWKDRAAKRPRPYQPRYENTGNKRGHGSAGLVTVLCRSSERFKLVSGDRRNHEAYGRFQARGRKDCVEQWVVTHACCGRSGYWQIHSGEMDSELSSGRAGIRASG